MSTHPSFLALDREALGVGEDETRAHLETCEQCRVHVQAVSTQPAMPAAIRPRRARRAWPFALAFGAVASLALLWVAVPQDGPAIQAKGHASVAVFVKRGTEVFMWDGKTPLRVDDRVQLMIEPAGMDHVYVRDGEGHTMYSGALQSELTTLPLSWRIDAAGSSETFSVVLSAFELRDDELDTRPDVLRQHVVLLKEALR